MTEGSSKVEGGKEERARGLTEWNSVSMVLALCLCVVVSLRVELMLVLVGCRLWGMNKYW